MLGASTPLLALTALTSLVGVTSATLDPIVIKVSWEYAESTKIIAHRYRVPNSSTRPMVQSSSLKAWHTKPVSLAMDQLQ